MIKRLITVTSRELKKLKTTQQRIHIRRWDSWLLSSQKPPQFQQWLRQTVLVAHARTCVDKDQLRREELGMDKSFSWCLHLEKSSNNENLLSSMNSTDGWSMNKARNRSQYPNNAHPWITDIQAKQRHQVQCLLNNDAAHCCISSD